LCSTTEMIPTKLEWNCEKFEYENKGLDMSDHSRKGVLALCAAVLWIVTASPLSGQRGWNQGEMWMKWPQEARESYLLGYFEAYTSYIDSCHQDRKQWQGEINTARIAESVTNFYKRYPDDRDIYLQEVIEQLGNGLSIEQIHKFPFKRRSSSSDKQ
jgi:hypothetical protein